MPTRRFRILERLITNLEAELSMLGNRLDNLEGRVSFFGDCILHRINALIT